MRTIKVTEIPACDFCRTEGTGIYDGPTYNGSWANMCEECIGTHADISNVKRLGTKRVLRLKPVKPAPEGGEVLVGIEASDPMDIVCGDGNREIECPNCSELRSVEPDADYEFTCEGCGARIKCPVLI